MIQYLDIDMILAEHFPVYCEQIKFEIKEILLEFKNANISVHL